MRNSQRLATTLLACALGAGLTPAAQAATFLWNVDSGNWSDGGSWVGGVTPPNDATADIQFNRSAAAVATVDAPWSVKSVTLAFMAAGNSATIEGSALTIKSVNNTNIVNTGSVGDSLIFNNNVIVGDAASTGTVFVRTEAGQHPVYFNATVSLPVQSVRVYGGGGVYFNDVVSGAGAIHAYSGTGGGLAILNAANTFTGRMTLAGGTVNVLVGDNGNAAANPNSMGMNGIINLYANSTINYTAANAQTFSTLLWAQGVGPVTLAVVDPAGDITVQSGFTQRVPASNSDLVLSGVGTGTLTGAFSNNGGVAALAKSGSGTWKLTAASNPGLNGTVSITQGTLLVNGTLANNGAVSVAAAGTLGGSGSIANTTTVSGTLAPGNSPGTLTLAAVVLNSDAVLSYELNALDQTVGSNINDLLQVNGNLTLDGTFNLASIIGGTELALGSYRLINYTGLLTDNTLDLGTGLPSGFIYSIDTATTGQVNLVVAAIPEPATFGLLAISAVGGLMFAARRKTLP
ncbi:MAG: PEP-CTERM sorting domain-containing protein [Phycisphaerales bacterium]